MSCAEQERATMLQPEYLMPELKPEASSQDFKNENSLEGSVKQDLLLIDSEDGRC